MKEHTKSILPKFPLFSLTTQEWNPSVSLVINEGEGYYYSNSEKHFRENCLNHILIDCEGYIFRISGKEELSKWRRFVPFVAKAKLKFEPKENMNLETFRAYILKKIEEINAKGFFNELKSHVLSAESFKEIIQKFH